MVRKSTFFISDIHFMGGRSAAELHKYRMVKSFFEHVAEHGQELFILGDYFDFGIDYRHSLPSQNVRGLALLVLLADAGVQIHYLVGNHDFWLGDFLQKELDIKLYYEPFSISRNGKNIYLIHGDGLSDLDKSYRTMRRILRARFNQYLFRWLHPDLGIALANRMSHASKNQDVLYTKYNQDESYFKSLNTIFDQGYDMILMGHHHQPMMRVFNKKIYYNLGDWIQHGSYLESDAQGFSQKTWKLT